MGQAHLGNDRTRRHTWEGSLEADVLQLRDRAGQAEPDHAHAQAAHPVPADVSCSTPHPLEVLRHRVTPGHTAAYDRAVSRGDMRWDGCHSSPAICAADVRDSLQYPTAFAQRDKPPARREVLRQRHAGCNRDHVHGCAGASTEYALCRARAVPVGMLPLPLLAAQQAQAQLVAWHGIKTVDGSPPPRPLRGYCGARKKDKTTEELRHAPSACASTFRQWYADGSDPSLRACAERCLTCRESGGACRYVSYSFDRAGSPSP